MPEYDDRALYEKLILDGFQAGLSWITILRKRENFRNAFDDFQPEKIARYNAKKVHALMNDVGIVRNRAKIEGTVASAKSYLKIKEDGARLFDIPLGFRRRQAEGQQLQDHGQRAGLDAAVDQDIQGTAARGFKFVGPTIVYAFMQATGIVNDHLVTCFCHEACAGKQPQRPASKPNDDPQGLSAPPMPQPGLAAHAVGPAARPARPLAARYRDRRHRPWAGAGRALERPDPRRTHLLGGAAHAAGGAVMREQMPRVDRRVRLAALLHDAPEYVIGDMISPFKAVLGGDYKAVEKRLLAAIHIRFGLPPVLAEEITSRSRPPTAARPISRRRELAGFAEAEAKRLFGRDPGLPEATRRDYLTPWRRPGPRSGFWRGSETARVNATFHHPARRPIIAEKGTP